MLGSGAVVVTVATGLGKPAQDQLGGSTSVHAIEGRNGAIVSAVRAPMPIGATVAPSQHPRITSPRSGWRRRSRPQ
jgi:hypothetical protein